MEYWQTLSNIISNFAVAAGALLAGAAGLKILLDWASNVNESQRRNKLRGELRARYPSNKQNGNVYRLIETDFPPGWVYVRDKKNKEKHHIASMLTLIKLGFNRNAVEKISQGEFDSIREKEEFLTDGERYS